MTLNQAIAITLDSSPDAQAAAQQLAQAQASSREAKAQKRLQVTLNVTGSLSNADVIQPPPSHETFGTEQNTLTIPLPVGTKPGLAVRQANQQLAAAQATYRGARLAIAGQVSAAYYDVLRKQALQEGARQSLAAARQQLNGAQDRFRAGDVPQLDVLQAETPVAAAQASLAQAETAAVIARESLNDLLGRPLDAPLILADVSAAQLPQFPPLADAQASALSVSTDVAAADANVRADESALASARAYREPTLSLQGIDLHSKDATSFSREDTVQAEVSIPLTDGGVGRAQVQGAQAALAAARAQAQAARRRTLVAVSAAYLTAQSNIAQVTATQTALDIAQTTYDKSVLGYRNGLTPLADVLSAQNALNQARLAAIQARYDAASAQTSLQAALAGDTGTVASAAPVSPGGASAQAEPEAAPNNAAGASAPAGAGAPTDTPAGNSRSASDSSGRATP